MRHERRSVQSIHDVGGAHVWSLCPWLLMDQVLGILTLDIEVWILLFLGGLSWVVLHPLLKLGKCFLLVGGALEVGLDSVVV